MKNIKPPQKDLAKLGVTSDNGIGVDRDARIIRGRVVAQLGNFKDRRGQFTPESLAAIVELGNALPRGLRSRWTHPTLSEDGLGKHLGYDHGFYVDGDKVRSKEFRLSALAFKAGPSGGQTSYGEYLMDAVEENADTLSSSLVLRYDARAVEDKDGNQLTEQDGTPVPDIWIPTELKAIDVVETGAAVDAFLGEGHGENDKAVRLGVELLDQFFDGEEVDRSTVQLRVDSYLKKYLDYRYPKEEDAMSEEKLDAIAAGQEKIVEGQSQLCESINGLVAALKPEKPEPKEGGDLSELTQKISALCAQQGHPDKIADFVGRVADGSLSYEGVQSELLAINAPAKSLSNEDITPPAPAKKKSADPFEALREEYRENRKEYAACGVTEKVYVYDRAIEEGLLGESAEILGADPAMALLENNIPEDCFS